MARFNCTKCGYHFELSRNVPPQRCPYCGAEKGVRPEQNAEELLKGMDMVGERIEI